MSASRGHAVEFTGPERVEVVPTARPEPGPQEVIVETEISAISAGTEMLIYRGNVSKNTPADETLPGLEGSLTYPLRYGYAAVGKVTNIGEGVDPEWRDRTVFGFNPHESHFSADPEHLMPIPETLSAECAAFLAKLETAVNFVLDGNPRIGERIAVFGQGVIGLLTTAILARGTAAKIIAVEPVAARRELAETMGADRSIDPARTDPANQLQETEGGVDLAIEVSGNPEALETAVASTRYGGRVIVGSWYGTKREPVGLDVHFHRNRVRVESSQVSTISPELRGRWDVTRRRNVALETLAKIRVEHLISHRIPVSDASRAYELLSNGPRGSLQILLTYP